MPVAGKKGELEIAEEEIAVILRIFEAYVSGISPRSIAQALNCEHIPAPRGKQWNASTITGNGILRNSIYTGKIVWNHVRMVKDPSTGKRVSLTNGDDKIETTETPHLRIIGDESFAAAVKRKEGRGGERARIAPKNQRLLSGLLKCAECGGELAILGADRSGPRVMCSNRRESQSCSQNSRCYIEKIERDVVNRLRIMFADASIIEAYVEEYQPESKRIALERRNSRGVKESALADIQVQITCVLEQVAKGTIEEEDVLAVLPALKSDRARLKADLEAEEPPTNVIEIGPKAVMKFREDVENRAETLKNRGFEPSTKLAKAFREVVSEVVIYPTEIG